MSQLERSIDYYQTRVLMIEESIRLIKTDPEKHTGKVLGLWMMPLLIRGTGIAKEAYFFMRHIDDVVDGDLLVENPLSYVEEIRKDVFNDNQNQRYPIEKLAFRSLKVLNQRKKNGDNPKQDFLDGIDVAIRDHKRAEKKEILTADELSSYYIKSFDPHFNIMLTAVGSNLRSRDVETFSYCQYFAYGVQDFETDWQRGLINIPKETLKLAGLTVENSSKEIRSNLIVKQWVDFESHRNRIDLSNFLEDINNLPNEKSAQLLFNSLSKRVIRILDDPNL
jgi:phytoene/squalene synthetase